MAEHVGRVLVVDDEQLERELLRGLLAPKGFQIEEASSGSEALGLLADSQPDCVILDVVMPGIDGIEVCRRLKEDRRTTIVPVIIITADAKRESRLQAIRAGADDFMTKPFDAEEVLLRVANAVRTKGLYDRVESDLSALEKLEATKNSLTYMLVHDLRQPLTGIKAYSDAVASDLRSEGRERLAQLATKVVELVDSVDSMVSLILDITRLEEGKMPIHIGNYDLLDLCRKSVAKAGLLLEAGRVRISAPREVIALRCDAALVERVIDNLLSNALKFSPGSEEISFTLGIDDDLVHLSITDAGPGIPAEYHELIFEKYGQVQMGPDRRKHSSGLGLAFCKLAVEAHGGLISIDSSPGKGSTFRVSFPA